MIRVSRHFQRCLTFRSSSSLAISQVPDDMLRQLLDCLKDKPQATSNMMTNTIQLAMMKGIQAEFYVDEWPQFNSIIGRITSPTVTDIVLYTSSKSQAGELLHHGCILKSNGCHKQGGLIFADIEASLAKHLMENIISRDGKPLLKKFYSAKMLQLPKEKAASFSESKPKSLPEGYFIGVLKPRDGKLLHRCWNRTIKNHTRDEQQFEHIISTLPTSAVFHKDDPTCPVGWMLAYPCGRMGHAYVKRSHRNKKLISVLAKDLCRKMLKVGVIPEVLTSEDHVIRTALDNGFVYCCSNYDRLYVDRISDCHLA